MDFISDQLHKGRRFRVLNVVDDFSREMIGQLVSVSISGREVARFLDDLIEQRQIPQGMLEPELVQISGRGESTTTMFARIAHLTICHLLRSHTKQHKVDNSHRRDGTNDGERSVQH